MGALLKSTCTTFLKTLDECMQIANSAFSSDLLYCSPTGSPPLAVPKSNKVNLSDFQCHNTVPMDDSVVKYRESLHHTELSRRQLLIGIGSYTKCWRHYSTNMNWEAFGNTSVRPFMKFLVQDTSQRQIFCKLREGTETKCMLVDVAEVVIAAFMWVCRYFRHVLLSFFDMCCPFYQQQAILNWLNVLYSIALFPHKMYGLHDVSVNFRARAQCQALASFIPVLGGEKKNILFLT